MLINVNHTIKNIFTNKLTEKAVANTLVPVLGNLNIKISVDLKVQLRRHRYCYSYIYSDTSDVSIF